MAPVEEGVTAPHEEDDSDSLPSMHPLKSPFYSFHDESDEDGQSLSDDDSEVSGDSSYSSSADCSSMPDDRSLRLADLQRDYLESQAAVVPPVCSEDDQLKHPGQTPGPPRNEIPLYDVRRLAEEPPYSTIYPGAFYTTEDKHYRELIKRLDKARCPKYMFKSVLDWAKAADADGFRWRHDHPDRDAYTRKLQQRFSLPPPTTVNVGLEYAQGTSQSYRSVDVVIWDAGSQIQRLLTNHELMMPQNLVINDPDDPYAPYIPDKRGDELQDAQLFQNAQRELRKNPKDFVIGTQIYANKTHATINGRYTLEPWVMCLSITNSRTRARWEAWIVLGYITDIKLSTAENDYLNATKVGELISINCRNYHRQLDVILRGYRKIQYGVEMYVAVAYTPEVRNVILPLLNINGDGMSSDKLCARFANYDPNKIDRLVWNCNCPSSETHLPNATCKFNEQDDIEPLVRDALGLSGCSPEEQQHAIKELHNYAMYPVYLAFYRTLNANKKHGVYGMIGTNLMHAFDEGLIPKIEEIFLLRVGGKKAKTLVDRLL